MTPDWFDRPSFPPTRLLLGVILGSGSVGTGFARYAQITDGSGPVLDVVSVFGLWSLGAVVVVAATLPTALGYNVVYSYAIPFGLLFGAVSVIGIAYAGTPPSQVEKFGYGVLFGCGSALVFGTLGTILGTVWNQIIARSTSDVA